MLQVLSNQTRPRTRDLLVQLKAPLRNFLRTEVGSAGLLFGATLLALLWANSPWSDLYEALWNTEVEIRFGTADLAMDLGHWINDGLMVLFFFVVGLEVRHEVGRRADRSPPPHRAGDRRAGRPRGAGVAVPCAEPLG